MTAKARQLHDIEIDEVSLVDSPANVGARMVLFKRDAKANSMLDWLKSLIAKRGMTTGQIMDSENAIHEWYKLCDAFNRSVYSILYDCEAEGAEMAKLLRKSVEEFADAASKIVPRMTKADLAKAQSAILAVVDASQQPISDESKRSISKAVEALASIRETAKGEKPVSEATVETVAKADYEKLQKQLDEAGTALKAEQAKTLEAERVAKDARQAQELAVFTKRAADEMGNLPGTPEAKGKLLKSISDALTDDGDKRLLGEILSAANVSAGKLFVAVGKDGVPQDQDDPMAEVRRQAQIKLDKGEVKTIEQGIDQVIMEKPELQKKFVA